MPRARAAALKAIELDDTLAEAHSSLGFIKLVFDWDWPAAEQELRKALELNPNSPLAHVQYAEYLLLVPHRMDEGIQEFQRAYALDPLVPSTHGDLVWFLFESRRYAESIEEASRELEDDSPFLALSYAELGRRDEAAAVADRAARTASLPVVLAQTASAYALAGRRDKAYALLDAVVKQAPNRYICGTNVACVYSALGDKEKALAWLEKAYRDRSD
jgi:tetratricopeptide (TPR) repeat protein